MFSLDEKKLEEISEENFREFLNREKRSLTTYTKDSNLMYIPKKNLERFYLKPKEKTLYLPLATFLERDLDENEIMFHIYYELSLYSDWKKNADKYLKRKEFFQREIDEITKYIIKKIKKEGLNKDPAYSEIIISNYVKREILDFLYIMDKYYSFLMVLSKAPIYRLEENKDKLNKYLKKNLQDKIIEMPKHRAFANSFIRIELKQEFPEIERTEINPFNEKIFGENIFEFTRMGFIRQINENAGIIERYSFIRSFIYPVYERIFKEEIDEITFQKSKSGRSEKSISADNPFNEKKENINQDKLQSTREEQEKILEEMLKEKQEIEAKVENIIKGKINLKPYGIEDEEQELFNYYTVKMNSERNKMKEFWRNLIGNAKKEENVKKKNQTKGKLDVDSLIENYPSFVEAEKKGSYKNLRIFKRYDLEKTAKKLPEKIEISFLIDNSGSMDKSKIEAARKAIALTLLSIEDFNKYLRENAEKLNQKIQVSTETWYYGSNYYKVKDFYYSDRLKEKSAIIKTITKLKGDDGATDDASCLSEINKGISKKQESELKRGRIIKIIFVITDGASSFPGLAKNAVDELDNKNVKMFTFQIGKNSDKNKDIFNFVWNDDKIKRGIIVGEEVEKLPEILLNTVGLNIKEIFKN